MISDEVPGWAKAPSSPFFPPRGRQDRSGLSILDVRPTPFLFRAIRVLELWALGEIWAGPMAPLKNTLGPSRIPASPIKTDRLVYRAPNPSAPSPRAR